VATERSCVKLLYRPAEMLGFAVRTAPEFTRDHRKRRWRLALKLFT
jgi:hypothetical protein